METFVVDDARLRTPINPTSTHGAGFFGSQSHPLTSTEIGRKAHTHARRLLRDADMPCSDAERRTIELSCVVGWSRDTGTPYFYPKLSESEKNLLGSLPPAAKHLGELMGRTAAYKTKECRGWWGPPKYTGHCPYNERCRFQHEKEEARRDPLRHPYAVREARTYTEVATHPLVLLRQLACGETPHLAMKFAMILPGGLEDGWAELVKPDDDDDDHLPLPLRRRPIAERLRGCGCSQAFLDALFPRRQPPVIAPPKVAAAADNEDGAPPPSPAPSTLSAAAAPFVPSPPSSSAAAAPPPRAAEVTPDGADGARWHRAAPPAADEDDDDDDEPEWMHELVSASAPGELREWVHEAAPGELCELCAPADEPRAVPPPRARKLAFGSEAVAPPPFADVTNLRLPPLPPQKAAAADASLEDGFMSLDDILDASAVYHLPADFLGGAGDGADDEYCALVGADGGIW